MNACLGAVILKCHAFKEVIKLFNFSDVIFLLPYSHLDCHFTSKFIVDSVIPYIYVLANK